LSQASYLKYCSTLLYELSYTKFPFDAILFSFDAESLYLSIPNDDGLCHLCVMIQGKLNSLSREDFILNL